MLFTEQANQIFNRAIADYHVTDSDSRPANRSRRGPVAETSHRQEQSGPYRPGGGDRFLVPSALQRSEGVARGPSEHREPSLGRRPSEHPCPEDLSHEGTGGASGCLTGAHRQVSGKAQCAVGATERPLAGTPPPTPCFIRSER